MFIYKDRNVQLFSPEFEQLSNSNQSLQTTNYYYNIIQRLVKRMLDIDQQEDFSMLKSEFQNPACHVLYMSLCEIICLEIFYNDSVMFSQNICQDIIELFFKCRFKNEYKIENKHFAYWINAAGLIIANMPVSIIVIKILFSF